MDVLTHAITEATYHKWLATYRWSCLFAIKLVFENLESSSQECGLPFTRKDAQCVNDRRRPTPMPSRHFTPWPTRSVRNSTPSTDGPMPSCFHVIRYNGTHAQPRQLHGLSTTTTVQMKIPRYRSRVRLPCSTQKKLLKLTQSCIRTR